MLGNEQLDMQQVTGHQPAGLDNAERPAIRIEVEGYLGSEWSAWFDGLEFSSARADDGVMVTSLTGTVIDQSALYGILDRLRDLGLTLRSFQQRMPEPATQELGYVSEEGRTDERDDDSSH